MNWFDTFFLYKKPLTTMNENIRVLLIFFARVNIYLMSVGFRMPSNQLSHNVLTLTSWPTSPFGTKVTPLRT